MRGYFIQAMQLDIVRLMKKVDPAQEVRNHRSMEAIGSPAI